MIRDQWAAVFLPFIGFYFAEVWVSFVCVAMEAITKHVNYPVILCSKESAVAKLSTYCAWEDFSLFCATACIPEEIIGEMCLINDPVS